MARKKAERAGRKKSKKTNRSRTASKAAKTKVASKRATTTAKPAGMLAAARSKVQQAVFAVVEGALDVTAKALGAKKKKRKR